MTRATPERRVVEQDGHARPKPRRARRTAAPAPRAAACPESPARPAALKILHAITGLSIGGAEWMLYRLLVGGDRQRFAPVVVSLLRPGAIARRIEALEVPIVSLGLQQGLPRRLPVFRLGRTARSLRPDLVQGWMYHGNLAATLGWWFLEDRCPMVWSIHHSAADIGNEKLFTRLAVRISARLSHLPAAIVYCSVESARQHEQLGFLADRTVVIPNGFDCSASKPDPDARARLCLELGIDPQRTLIGVLTRAHPMKDHGNMVRAMAKLVARGVDAQLILAGRGVEDPDGPIAQAVEEAAVGNRIRLLGERPDIRPVVAGLDILVSCSAWGEAFPLIVGDAMASGVPCVVTDVGDCAWIVGDTGVVVPPRDSEALAAALARLVAAGPAARRRQGSAARERIQEKFSLANVAGQYEALYRQLAERHRPTRPVPGQPRPIAAAPGPAVTIEAALGRRTPADRVAD
jgi:glycosyltransferase involved in cell wall biosynthesis